MHSSFSLWVIYLVMLLWQGNILLFFSEFIHCFQVIFLSPDWKILFPSWRRSLNIWWIRLPGPPTEAPTWESYKQIYVCGGIFINTPSAKFGIGRISANCPNICCIRMSEILPSHSAFCISYSWIVIVAV